MKKLISLLFFVSLNLFAQTKAPIQLLNPAGSTAGQVIVSTGATSAPAWGSPSTSAAQYIATLGISGSLNQGAFAYGTLSYSDTNIFSSLQCNVNGYCQSIWQNTNSGSAASIDLIVSNNLGTALGYYGNFGMNSSGFTGSGSFNLPNAVYMTSNNGDLSIGTLTANAIHFVVNSGATDAGGFSNSGIFSLNTALAITSGGTGQSTANAGFNSLSPMTTLGDIIFGGASGVGTRLAGNSTTTKNFLIQTGNGSTSTAPAWGAIAAGDVPTLNQSTTGNAATSTSSTTATNIAGGLAGSIPYQTGANTTALLATGSGVLVGGTTPAWSTTPTLTGTNFTGVPYSALSGTVPTWNQSTTGNAATSTLATTATTANALNTLNSYTGSNFTATNSFITNVTSALSIGVVGSTTGLQLYQGGGSAYGVGANSSGGLDIMANQVSMPVRIYAGSANASPTLVATFTNSGATFPFPVINTVPQNMSAAIPTIASATTIAPTTPVIFVSGTTAIATITAPTGCTHSCSITIIPTGAFSTTTAGNISIVSTAVVSKALIMTYDATGSKWYPSY